ncbi:MAG: hypothetical protein R3E97_14420 [Candidatus Eisenbacteria bacterium]
MHILSMVVFWIATSALLLLPGALVARSIPALWDRIGPGERILPAFLLSAGWIGMVWGVSLPLFPTVTGAGVFWVVGTVCFGAVQGVARKRRTAAGAALTTAAGALFGGKLPSAWRLLRPGNRWTTLTALALIAIAWLVVSRDGGPLGYMHDSLDFIAFVRRMLESGRIDIVSAAYRDTTGLGPDPRRGAFHLGMALVSWATRTDPVDMWRWLPSVLAPLSLWVFFATFRRVLSSPRSALFALGFFIVALLLGPEHFLQNLAYASRLGWVYSWVALWAVAYFLDLDRWMRTPPLDWSAHALPTEVSGRPGRSAALLAIAAPTILLGVHVLSALQCVVALAGFAWTWALARKEPRPIRRWLFAIPLASFVLLLPFLGLKLLGSYSTANPIFDHPQGLLYLGKGMMLLAPDSFARWFGWHGLLAMLLLLPLLRRAFESRAHAFLVGSSVVAALVLWNPLATWVIEKAGAHSLLFRMLYVAPIYPILGYYGDWALRRFRDPRAWWRVALAAAYLLGAAAMLFLQAKQAISFFQRPPSHRAPWAESLPLREALEWLNEADPEPKVVVSDPTTNYQIPAYSSHYAISPFHQHSSPADDRAVLRIRDAASILNPYVPMDRTLELLRQYGAEYVLLNQSFPRYIRFFLTSITPETFEEDRRKFEQLPDVFPRVYERDGVSIYRFVDPGPGFHLPAPVNPYLVLDPNTAGTKSADEIARMLGAIPTGVSGVDGLELIGVIPSAKVLGPGDMLDVLTYYRRTEPADALPVYTFYRLETAWPNRWFLSRFVGKPYQTIYERRKNAILRFGRPRSPLEDRFPSYLWEVGAVYADTITIPVPRNAVPGLYTLSIKLIREPFSQNHELRDYMELEDSLQGRPVTEIRILESGDEEETN